MTDAREAPIGTSSEDTDLDPGPRPATKNPALQSLEEREAQHGLWTRTVLGYPVWPLLRLPRYRDALLSGDAVIRPRQPTKRAFGGRLGLFRPGLLAERLAALTRAARRANATGATGQRDVWLLTSSSYRRRTTGATTGTSTDDLPCVFAAHLQQQLGPRLLSIEAGTTDVPELATRDDVVHLDPYIDLLQAFASAAAASDRLLVDAGTAAAFSPTRPPELVRRAAYGHGLERLGRLLVRRLRPKAVFVLCAYGSMIPLQRAVRAAGVPLIELQHGVIHESHPGYVFGPDVPLRDHRPDHLVLFGRHFGSLIDRVSPGFDGTWSVGGHPWLRRARTGGKQPPQPAEQAAPVVVFGQYDPPVQAALSVLVPALRRALPEATPLLYKPHPREPMQDLAPKLRAAGVTLAEASDDTYRLLARCRAAITVYSTVAIEALAFECQSLVIRSPYWTDDIRSLVADGMLEPVTDAGSIARALDERAHRPSAGQEREVRANALFGLDEPEPDFAALIADISRR